MEFDTLIQHIDKGMLGILAVYFIFKLQPLINELKVALDGFEKTLTQNTLTIKELEDKVIDLEKEIIRKGKGNAK